MRIPRTATKSSPHSPQLEKARVKQRRLNAAKNKLINLKRKALYWKQYKMILCIIDSETPHPIPYAYPLFFTS